MTMTERAIDELKRAGLFDKDSDYEGAIGQAVEELLLLFQKQGHSGMSAMYVADLFNKLVRGHVLTPLTDDPSEWMDVDQGMFQSKRCPYVFREPNERPYTLHGKIFSNDGGKTFFTNMNSRVYFDLPGFPPETEKVILRW